MPVSRPAGVWRAGTGVVPAVGTVVPGRRPAVGHRGRRAGDGRPAGGGGVIAGVRSNALVVDCPACWFPGGAPVGDGPAAGELADAHDQAAHGGTPTAVIRAVGSAGGAAVERLTMPQRRVYELVLAGVPHVDELAGATGYGETFLRGLLHSVAEAGLLERVAGGWRAVARAEVPR